MAKDDELNFTPDQAAQFLHENVFVPRFVQKLASAGLPINSEQEVEDAYALGLSLFEKLAAEAAAQPDDDRSVYAKTAAHLTNPQEAASMVQQNYDNSCLEIAAELLQDEGVFKSAMALALAE